jgi:TonB-dependent receptor
VDAAGRKGLSAGTATPPDLPGDAPFLGTTAAGATRPRAFLEDAVSSRSDGPLAWPMRTTPGTNLHYKPNPINNIMTPRLRILRSVAWWLLASMLAAASGMAASAPTSTGIVTGRVVDVLSNHSLQGASVRVLGTSYEASTDPGGVYRLPPLPAGDYEIRVSYLGHEPTTRRITVAPGATVEANFALGSGVQVMDAFHVTSLLEGQARAINRQRAADTITTVIASDDSGNLPDRSVEDLLSRVAGISLSGGGGVTIRGASPELNTVMLDGERMSSAFEGAGGRLDSISDSSGENQGRDISVSNIDADLISSIEVVRAFPASMDADGIGGAVNLITRSAFDLRKPILRGRFDYTDNRIGGDAYGAAVTFGDVIGRDQRWGYIVNLSHTRDKAGFERGDISYNYTGFDFPYITSLGFRYQTRDVTNYGINATIDYKLSRATTLSFKGFFNRTEEELFSGRMTFSNLQGHNFATLTPDFQESLPVNMSLSASQSRINFQRHPSHFVRERDYYRFSFKGQTQANRFRLNYEANFDHAAAGQDGVRVTARTPGVSVVYGNVRNDTRAGWTIDRTDKQFPTIVLVNPYEPEKNGVLIPEAVVPDVVESTVTAKGRNYEQGYNARADVRIPWRLGGFPVTFDSGMKYRGKYRTAAPGWTRYQLGGNPARLALPIWDRPSEALFLEGGMTPPPLARGRYPVLGTFANPRAVLGWYQDKWAAQPPEQQVPEPHANTLIRVRLHEDVARNMRENFSAREDIFATYGMATVDIHRLRLLGGVRVEHTQNTYTGRQFNFAPLQTMKNVTALSAKSDYTNFFPNAIGTYRLTENHLLRAGISKTIARPNYAAMAPFVILPDDEDADDPSIVVEVGNPDLKAQQSLNFDLSYEWYFQPIGLFTLAGFQKNIDKFIYNSIKYENVLVNVALPDEPEELVEVTRQRSTKMNGADARLQGIEVSWQQHLKFLPSPFDGFGLNLNYTFIKGRSRIPDDITGAIRSYDFLFRQADEVYNAQLFYEKYRVRARVAVRHNGGYVSALTSSGNQRISPTAYWDASMQYTLGRGLTLFLESRNITRELTSRYVDAAAGATPTNWEYRNWGYRGGVRFNFR